MRPGRRSGRQDDDLPEVDVPRAAGGIRDDVGDLVRAQRSDGLEELTELSLAAEGGVVDVIAEFCVGESGLDGGDADVARAELGAQRRRPGVTEKPSVHSRVKALMTASSWYRDPVTKEPAPGSSPGAGMGASTSTGA
jgi:hypothetical protein